MAAPAPSPSFDDWFRQARPKLLRLAVSRLRDHGEAEDVVQETALAVWKRQAAGGVDDLDAYAARAVWQNAIRRSVRRRDWATLEDAEMESAWVRAEAEDWIETEALEAAIAQLPPAQQATLRLRFYTGLSFKEIATALTISLNTAASRCRYALEALRHSLDHPLEDEDGNETGNKPGKHRPGSRQLRPRRKHRRGGRA